MGEAPPPRNRVLSCPIAEGRREHLDRGAPPHRSGVTARSKSHHGCDGSRSVVVEDVTGSRAAFGGFVVGVHELAELQRQAAAADAPTEPVAKALEHGDLGVEAWTPPGGQALPERGQEFLPIPTGG